MLVLSISANDMLCSCSSKGATSTVLTDPTLQALGRDMNADNVIDRNDFVMMFASENDGCKPPYMEIVGYCKFMGGNSTVVIYS